MLHPVLPVQPVFSLLKEKPIVLHVLTNVLLVSIPKITVLVVLNIETMIHQSVLKIALLYIVNAISKEICS